MSEFAFDVSIEEFEAKVLIPAETVPVVVDFWAPWCEPCKVLKPMLEKLAAEFKGRFLLAKVNADDNRAVSEQCVVRGLPTLILFRDGLEVDRVVGAAGKTRIAAVLDKQLEA